MKISQKLKLNSLLVLALLVLNVAVVVFLIHRMMEDRWQLAESEKDVLARIDTGDKGRALRVARRQT